MYMLTTVFVYFQYKLILISLLSHCFFCWICWKLHLLTDPKFRYVPLYIDPVYAPDTSYSADLSYAAVSPRWKPPVCAAKFSACQRNVNECSRELIFIYPPFIYFINWLSYYRLIFVKIFSKSQFLVLWWIHEYRWTYSPVILFCKDTHSLWMNAITCFPALFWKYRQQSNWRENCTILDDFFSFSDTLKYFFPNNIILTIQLS